MIIERKTEICGFFKFEAYKVDNNNIEINGSRRICADWFPNLITDNGLNLIGTASNTLSACQVGSGSTTPSVLDTSLGSRIAGTTTVNSTSNGVQASSPYFAWRRNVYRFAAGVATGNISEVGISQTSSGTLFSRALILDGGGSPTTITVQSDEVLDVAYELRVYPSVSDWSDEITISSVVYDLIGRSALVTNSSSWLIPSAGIYSGVGSGLIAFNGSIGAITGSPSGTLSSATSATDLTYSNNSYRRDSTVTWGLSAGNLSGGIKSVSVQLGPGSYQFEFDPPISKDNTKTLELTFRHSWARKTL
jgi:hypothetical protein